MSPLRPYDDCETLQGFLSYIISIDIFESNSTPFLDENVSAIRGRRRTFRTFKFSMGQ